jgi:hypothetical protein
LLYARFVIRPHCYTSSLSILLYVFPVIQPSCYKSAMLFVRLVIRPPC